MNKRGAVFVLLCLEQRSYSTFSDLYVNLFGNLTSAKTLLVLITSSVTSF